MVGLLHHRVGKEIYTLFHGSSVNILSLYHTPFETEMNRKVGKGHSDHCNEMLTEPFFGAIARIGYITSLTG